MGDRFLKDAADVLADESLTESLSRFVAGELNAAESDALQEQLRDNPAAQDALILLTLQAESIRQLVGKPESQKPVAPGSSPHANAAPHADAEPAPGEASGTAYPIYRKGYEPQPARFRPAHYAIAGVAATLLAACGVAIYVYSSSLPHSPIPDPTSPPPVATLIHNTGTLTTPHDYPAEGEDYGRGEYTLSGGGTAEFMLTNAVNVKLRGETRMVIHDPMHVSLARGSAEFVCPTDAKGFIVNLPSGARVVDLGTRFSIDVTDGELTTVRVLTGSVELRTDEQTEAITLPDHHVAELDPATGRVLRVYEPIQLANASFESPTTTGHTQTPPADWNWDGVGGIGVAHEGIGGFESPYGDAPDGTQWLYLRAGAAIAQPVAPSDGIAEVRLRVAFVQMNQKNVNNGGGVAIELWDGDPIAAGTLVDAVRFAPLAPGVAEPREASLASPTALASPVVVVRHHTPEQSPDATSNVSIDDLRIARTTYQNPAASPDAASDKAHPEQSLERSTPK